MTGVQLQVVLVVGSICLTIALCTLFNAWARRAQHRASTAYERRLIVEAELAAARDRAARATADPRAPAARRPDDRDEDDR